MNQPQQHNPPPAQNRRTTLEEPVRAALVGEAVSPRTPPLRLAALSKIGDDALNSLIAANPNTPEKTLHALWRTHPLCALENPILLYWSLREGKPLRRLLPMDVKIALYLALRRNCPVEVLEEHLPESERCEWLGSGPYYGEINAIGAYADTRPRRVALRDGVSKSVKARVAKIHQILVTDPSDAVRTALAENIDSIPLGPDERTHLQRLLAKDPCPLVRRGVASSTQVNAELHTQLSKDPELEVRRTLASNPSRQAGAGVEGWHNLIASGHAAEVAANPACPEPVKIELVCNGSPRERYLAWAGIRFTNSPTGRPFWRRLNSSLPGRSASRSWCRSQRIRASAARSKVG